MSRVIITTVVQEREEKRDKYTTHTTTHNYTDWCWSVYCGVQQVSPKDMGTLSGALPTAGHHAVCF